MNQNLQAVFSSAIHDGSFVRRRRQPSSRSSAFRISERQERLILVLKVIVVVVVIIVDVVVKTGCREARRCPTVNPISCAPLKHEK